MYGEVRIDSNGSNVYRNFNTTSMTLTQHIEKYKQWRAANPFPMEYEDWFGGMYDAAFEVVDTKSCSDWTPQEISDLLFLIANDNLDLIAERLGNAPKKLLTLAKAALTCSDPDAKWPLAVELGLLAERKDEAESILLSFVYDSDEYLSRRALLALGSLRSDQSEALAERAWESGHLYQRIASLSVLEKIRSSKLQQYLRKAHEDGREYLVKNALKIEAALD